MNAKKMSAILMSAAAYASNHTPRYESWPERAAEVQAVFEHLLSRIATLEGQVTALEKAAKP